MDNIHSQDSEQTNPRTNFSSYHVIWVSLPQEQMDEWETLNQIALNQFDCQGIEEFALNEEETFEVLGSDSFCGGDLPLEHVQELEKNIYQHEYATWKFFFYDQECEKKALSFFQFVNDHYPLAKSNHQTLIQEDWNQQWKQYYRPLFISENLCIIPSWEKGKTDFPHPFQIFINPGMGFGTGDHETTFLCLRFFNDIVREGKKASSCLDFGCGSGILGIAAGKMLCSKVDLFDIDENALQNAHQNLELNFLQDQEKSLQHAPASAADFRFILASSQKGQGKDLLEESYDIIFANILFDVLWNERDFLLQRLAPAGHLILSGVLDQQEEAIRAHYEKEGLECQKREQKGDWVCLLFQKRR